MSTIATATAHKIALSVCKGDYQKSLINGWASWAGSDLKGSAARYGGRYRDSRESLIAACRNAGLRVQVSKIGPRQSLVATILTRAEAARIRSTVPGVDPCIEGRALEARIGRVEKKAAAAARKRARELAVDEVALSQLTV